MKKKIINVLQVIKKNIFCMKVVIAALIIASAVVPLGIARAVCTSWYSARAISRLETELQNRCNLLAADINKMNFFVNQRNESIAAQIEQLTYTYSGRIIIVASNYVVVKDTYIDHENKTLVSSEVNQAFRGISMKTYNKEEGYLEMSLPIYGSDVKSIIGVILLTVPDTTVAGDTEYIDMLFRRVTEVVFFVALVAAVLCAWGISRPLSKLTAAIRGFTSGYMDKRLVEEKGFGEIQEVSAEVNKMLERLKTLDESRQEFVSNVSHELKTPITSIKVLADSLNSQEEVPIELYQEFMHDIVEEIDRESQIINDLLSLVRMDKTAAELNIAPQNMNELVERVLKQLKPIAAEKNIELVLESFRPVVAEVDEVKMSLVITNLVENAIKYNVANGWVRVSVNADHKYFYLTVSDSGIGIPDDSRDKIFERFYRVDKARSRQSGGTGLGLAITKNAILMHKGAIRVYSKEGEGSTFTVRIPLLHVK